jgi:uncharacterized membrane protein YsdA (DUF1294 family)
MRMMILMILWYNSLEILGLIVVVSERCFANDRLCCMEKILYTCALVAGVCLMSSRTTRHLIHQGYSGSEVSSYNK